MTGQYLTQRTGMGIEGENKITVGRDEFSDKSGLIYFQLTTEDFTASSVFIKQ